MTGDLIMLLFGILGFILVIGGIAHAIREHGRGRENYVTAYTASALFGLGMMISPVFTRQHAVAVADAAPVSSADSSVIAPVLAPFSSLNMGETRDYSMEFEQCLSFLAQAGGTTGQVPVNLIETNILRMVRLPASDGSIVLACSRLDRKLIVTLSRSRCGFEVNC